jgi:hypothetical protein
VGRHEHGMQHAGVEAAQRPDRRVRLRRRGGEEQGSGGRGGEAASPARPGSPRQEDEPGERDRPAAGPDGHAAGGPAQQQP